MRRTRLALLLGSGLLFGMTAETARAQIPLFYGGEVLTPLGNRRSDGSYIYPYQDPRYRGPVQTRAATVRPTTRNYYPTGATYTTARPRSYRYLKRRGYYVR
jgi:hypothetical protein